MSDRKHPGTERPIVDIAAATGGWPNPWPNVAEIAAVLPTNRWTLVGGLMTQLHSIHHGMVHIEGGTQALRRTINARLEIEPGIITTLSVPGAFGALILKAAAYKTDSRDPDCAPGSLPTTSSGPC